MPPHADVLQWEHLPFPKSLRDFQKLFMGTLGLTVEAFVLAIATHPDAESMMVRLYQPACFPPDTLWLQIG